jgi:transcriptional regulator with XRE-family HTH domain
VRWKLGWSVLQSTLGKIERGERDLSLNEAFILAHALSVPPAFLVLPLDDAELVEIAPGVIFPAGDVRDWLRGEIYPRVKIPSTSLSPSRKTGWTRTLPLSLGSP